MVQLRAAFAPPYDLDWLECGVLGSRPKFDMSASSRLKEAAGDR